MIRETVIVRRRSLVIGVIVVAVLVAIPGVVGFSLLQNGVNRPATEAKVAAEQFLLLIILADAGVVLTFVTLLVRSYNLSAALARIEAFQRLSGRKLHVALKRLGDVGESITRMYAELEALNARKSRRIAAMNALVSVIMNGATQRIIVVDSQGVVTRATQAAITYLKPAAGIVIGKPVDEIVRDADFSRVRAALGRKPGIWIVDGVTYPVAVQTVQDDLGEVSYFVYYFGSDAHHVTARRAEGMPAPAREAEKTDEDSGSDAGRPVQQDSGGFVGRIMRMFRRSDSSASRKPGRR